MDLPKRVKHPEAKIESKKIVETFTNPSNGETITSSFYGNNLLSGLLPLQLTSANFNFGSLYDVSLLGNININSLTNWSGYYSELKTTGSFVIHHVLELHQHCISTFF